MVVSGAAFTLGPALVPFSSVTPRAETLVARIIPSEMAVLDEPFLEVTTLWKCDLLVIAHLVQGSCQGGSARQVRAAWFISSSHLLTKANDSPRRANRLGGTISYDVNGYYCG
jgi:hypothetical protein